MASFGFMMTEHTVSPVHAAHEQSTAIDDCIIAVMGFCNTEGLSMAEHHLNAYQAFLNTPVSTFFTFSLLLVCLGLLSFILLVQQSKTSFVFQTLSNRDRIRASSYSDFYHKQTISHWLSLFETSPTLN
ncbi:MAG: hypothetical protein K0S38_520 [Candidatus Paceibacter sp.]|nr:hypothetical protein [Candidatus Paceibacter sp.]